MILSKRKMFVAVVIGCVLGGAPVVGYNYWLDFYIEKQGAREVDVAATRSIVLADRWIERVIQGLDDLAHRGGNVCSTAQIDAMHEIEFIVPAIKEMSVIGPNGQTYCTNSSLMLGQRRTLSNVVPTAVPDVALDIVRIGHQKERFLRVHRSINKSGIALAALIPGDLLVPQLASRNGSDYRSWTRIAVEDGTILGEGGGTEIGDNQEDRVVSRQTSEQFHLVSTVARTQAGIRAEYSEIRMMGSIGAGAISVLLLAALALTPWRQRDNPVTEIERALANGEFVPFYQPVVDIKSGRLRGAEVVVRWRRGNGTYTPPANFIPLCETSGLIVELTRALMRSTRDEVGKVIGLRPKFRIAFNLAACHFIDETVVGDIREIFESSPIDLSQVVLEVTERQPLEDLTAARRVIASLQGIGCRVAIDDVGAGHGGLSYLLKLGVDIIKID
ncbi:MAG TPA: EAL domain-containing protein, partial [Xanthobacteraceae bacterium]|nr:EAL domain-containing protein [Xanthobacteraceae bacterium]